MVLSPSSEEGCVGGLTDGICGAWPTQSRFVGGSLDAYICWTTVTTVYLHAGDTESYSMCMAEAAPTAGQKLDLTLTSLLNRWTFFAQSSVGVSCVGREIGSLFSYSDPSQTPAVCLRPTQHARDAEACTLNFKISTFIRLAQRV